MRRALARRIKQNKPDNFLSPDRMGENKELIEKIIEKHEGKIFKAIDKLVEELQNSIPKWKERK